MNSIEIKILDDKIGSSIPFPYFATYGSAGLDLSACLVEPLTLLPQEVALVKTGLAIHIKNENFMGLILPRSGLGHKHGLVLGNGTGVIDSDYQGPLMISCFNRSQKPYTIHSGDRIAQLIITPICRPDFALVKDFTEETSRGIQGFGSTKINHDKAHSS